MIENLLARIAAVELVGDPNDVAEAAIALHFEVTAMIKQLELADDKIKQLLADLMGEMGQLAFATPSGSCKLSRATVVTRLDTEKIKQKRAADPLFDDTMRAFEKISEQAGSLRFTPIKEDK